MGAVFTWSRGAQCEHIVAKDNQGNSMNSELNEITA